MNTLEAIQWLLSNKRQLVIQSDWSGRFLDERNAATTFYSEAAFRSRVEELKRNLVIAANREKFKSGLRVQVAADTVPDYAGKTGKIETFDASDNTVYVRLASGRTYWISAEKLTIVAFLVKDTVTIVDSDAAGDEDEECIIVQISDDSDEAEPYLVYVPSEDNTYWFSAEEIELVS